MKIAIAQSGPENAGKTTSIRMFFEMVTEKYPDAVVTRRLDNGKDIRCVVTIGDARIGIESQGDPWKKTARLEPSLALFVSLGCDAIICAARMWGGTLNAVRALEEHGYEVIVRSRLREERPEAQRGRNRAEALWMLERVDEILFAVAQ